MPFSIDLHIHTTFSGDSTVAPEEAIERALALGLDGVAFTEHNSFAASDPVERLKEKYGGEIIAEGTPDNVMKNPKSITGQYLTGIKQVPLPDKRRVGHKGQKITIKGARANNLANITVDFPLGTFTCVTGVSGGGKSSLVIETLYKALARRLHGARLHAGEHDAIEGVELIDKIVVCLNDKNLHLVNQLLIVFQFHLDIWF